MQIAASNHLMHSNLVGEKKKLKYCTLIEQV